MNLPTPFFALVRQELFRFWRLMRQTLVPPIITTLLFILIFGFSLGSHITEIHGFRYIIFIIPGLAAMGVINGSFSNTTTSLFMAKFDRSLENLLSTPLKPFQIVTAYLTAGIMRGLLIGSLILTVALLALKQAPQNPAVILYFFLTSSVIFGSWGMIAALRAKNWDSMSTLENFCITPLVYLGGVFYSIDLLPPLWRKVSMFNPIFYLVDGVRFGVLGVHAAPLWLSMGFAAALALTLFLVCVYLFHRGYKFVR
ncbi:MAG: ABC transporter permease [Deltaproteobacteria bacterium]|nr:ABC transporter permease [Deltaproteobacteria bacterium]